MDCSSVALGFVMAYVATALSLDYGMIVPICQIAL